MHIEARGVFDRAGEALEAPKVRREWESKCASAEATSVAMLFGYLICHRNHQLQGKLHDKQRVEFYQMTTEEV